MVDRELLEAMAQERVCACQHYELADNMQTTTDNELRKIIDSKNCTLCDKEDNCC
jgi:hypothetical protein